jgi:hypothetical protein
LFFNTGISLQEGNIMQLDSLAAVGSIRTVDIRSSEGETMSMEDIALSSTAQATASLTIQDRVIDRKIKHADLTDGRSILELQALKTERYLTTEIASNIINRSVNALNKLTSS